jgi:uncharacterized protein (TIGR00296 family)
MEAPATAGIHAGVFVTLNYLTRKNEEHLRGCIGFAQPHKELHSSVIEAAIAAATADPRFPPVDLAELPHIIFEVSVLSPPVELKGDLAQIQRSISIGRDGLILRWKHGSGLLLPQVPIELKWSVEEFIANLCYKAGANTDVLHDAATTLYSFQATIFKELEPAGKVARMKL